MFGYLSKLFTGIGPVDVTGFDTYRGNILNLWAGIECCMDQANYYAWLYTEKAIAPKVPLSLSQKIEMFRKANRDLLPFDPLKEQAADLLQRVRNHQEDRHWMAHGYLLPKECARGAWTLEKHKFPKGTGARLETVHRIFQKTELKRLRTTLTQLASDFADYTQALALQVRDYAPNDQRN